MRAGKRKKCEPELGVVFPEFRSSHASHNLGTLMALFKPKALPVIIEDIATSIHRASCNSATAISLLHDFVRIDPPAFDLDALVSRLSRDVFRLHQECYPAKEISQLLENIDATNRSGGGYWSIYAYLFALLPAFVERSRVGGSRWTAEEYHRLEMACFSRWCHAHDNRDDDCVIMSGYNRVQAATKSWFGRRCKLAAAIDSCASKTANEIAASFPRQYGSVRHKGFRFAVEELVDSLYSAFKADLAEYYLGAGAFRFLASNPAPLPSFIDEESGWP